MKPGTILVSDHAVLRWLERVEGYDIEALRADIARIAAIGLAHGAPVVIAGRGKIVIADNAVTTVLKSGWATRHEIGVLQAKLAPENEPEFRRRKPRKRDDHAALLTMAELYRLRADRKWLMERLAVTGRKRVRLVDRREIEARLRNVTTAIIQIEQGLKHR